MLLKGNCPECKKGFNINLWETRSSFTCFGCGKEFNKKIIDDIIKTQRIDQCPICNSRDFWIDKKFPKHIGLCFVVIAAILVPFTYGISFIILFALDLILWFLLRSRVNCYLCETEFVGFPKNSSYKKFDLKLYEYYKNSTLGKD
ncbi:MAG: hypothetical protein ACK4NF_05110 [Planctomycetota bacterium]